MTPAASAHRLLLGTGLGLVLASGLGLISGVLSIENPSVWFVIPVLVLFCWLLPVQPVEVKARLVEFSPTRIAVLWPQG